MSSPTPSLDELRECLVANGVSTNAEQFAVALLGLAHSGGWAEYPERVSLWLGQLALDVSKSRRKPPA